MTRNVISPASDPSHTLEEQPAAEREVRLPLEQVPGALLLLDRGGRIEQLNSMAESQLTVARQEAVGRDLFREVLPLLEAEGWGERYRSGVDSGRLSLTCETPFPQPDGPGRLRLSVCSFAGYGRIAAVVLLEDRSDVAAERRRRERAERLAAIGELASGVAHEINNPLASIQGFAQFLARDSTEPGELQALEIIRSEGARIARTMDGLLAFAEQQRTHGAEAMNLNELTEQMLDLRQYPLEAAGVEIVRELDPDLSPVWGERSQLQRVVLALLGQAERSLQQRDVNRRLVVRTRESTDGVVLYLTDNGGGIPRDRLATLLTDPREGTDGVGAIDLGTALAIVREHNGHLSANSIEGQGAGYLLRLPRCEIAPSAIEVQLEAPRPPSPGAPDRPLHVLVADDEATLRLALALFLGRNGHEVTQAADAYEALRLTQEQHFDVVMVDARMPGDGLALLEKLDADPALAGRTVLMTGDHTHRMAADAVHSSRPYLTKPFDMMDAIRLVESIGR